MVIAGLAAAGVKVFRPGRKADMPSLDNHHYQAIFDHSPSLIYVKDTESRLLIANRRFLEFHNVTADKALQGRTDEERIRDRTTVLEQNRVRLDGSEFWAHTVITPFI